MATLTIERNAVTAREALAMERAANMLGGTVEFVAIAYAWEDRDGGGDVLCRDAEARIDTRHGVHIMADGEEFTGTPRLDCSARLRVIIAFHAKGGA